MLRPQIRAGLVLNLVNSWLVIVSEWEVSFVVVLVSLAVSRVKTVLAASSATIEMGL